jgi:hypothetical protein
MNSIHSKISCSLLKQLDPKHIYTKCQDPKHIVACENKRKWVEQK